MHTFQKNFKDLEALFTDVEIEYGENGKMIWPEIPDEQYDRDATLAGAEREYRYGINDYLCAAEAIEGAEIIDPTPEQIQERAGHLRSVLEEHIAMHLEDAINAQELKETIAESGAAGDTGVLFSELEGGWEPFETEEEATEFIAGAVRRMLN